MMEAGTPKSRPLSRQALAALQERVGAAVHSDVPGKSRPSSRVSASSASSARMESLQEELAETERRLTATRQQQLKAEQALEGVMGERHAFDQQLLQRVRAAGKGPGVSPTPGARRPSPLQQAGAAMVPQQQQGEQQQQGAQQLEQQQEQGQSTGVPDEQYQELLVRYQAECEARQLAQQHLWTLQEELSVAVEEREAVLQSLQGIHSLYGDLRMEEDEALYLSGQYAVGGGEEGAFSWGPPGNAEPWAEDGASAAAADNAVDGDAASSEAPLDYEELQAAWHAVRADNEALQAEVRLTRAERDAVLSKLDDVEMELSLAARHQQDQACTQQQQQQQQQYGGEAVASWECYGSPLPPDRASPDSTIEGGSEEVTPMAGVPPQLLRRAGSTTPDISLDPSPSKATPQERRQQQQQQQQQRGKQGRGQQQDEGVVQQEGGEGSDAGVVEAAVADSRPQYQELRAVLQQLDNLVAELMSGQAGAAAAGGPDNRAKLAALQRHVGELQARSAVVCDELEASHAVVEDLLGGLARERRRRAELEGRLVAAQRESRTAERERAEMRQHLQELQELVEAAIDEAEGSWALLQKVTAEEGRGKKLKVGELWTQLMEAEQRATSALRTPKAAPAPSDTSSQQQRRLYEAWQALEGSRQQGDEEADSEDAWKRKLAQLSASSLRSRLASLNGRFQHEDDTKLPAPSASAASHASSAAGVDGAPPSAAQQLSASILLQLGLTASTAGGVGAVRASRPRSAPPDARWSQAALKPLPPAPGSLAASARWATPPTTGAAGLRGENGSPGIAGLTGVALVEEPDDWAEGQQSEQAAAGLQQRLECTSEGPGEAGPQQATDAEVAQLPPAGVPDADESLNLVQGEHRATLAMVFPANSPNASPSSTAPSATPQPPHHAAATPPGSGSSGGAGRATARRGGSSPLQLPFPPVGLHSPPLVPRSHSPSAKSLPAARAASLGRAAAAAAAAAGGGGGGWGQRAASPDLPYFRRDEGVPCAARSYWLEWLFPLPLRLLCANVALLALAPVNLLLFNRASACVSAGSSNFMGALFWLALMQRLPQRQGQQQGERPPMVNGTSGE